MDNLDTLTNMFEEFLNIYKFVNKRMISENLLSELNKPQLLEIYKLTDGSNSARDRTAKLTQKCSHTTILNIWKRWALKGIVVPGNTKGRYKSAFNLEEYGITEIMEGD